MKEKIKEYRDLLDDFYNYSMDNFNGQLREVAIKMFLEEKFNINDDE